MKVSCTDVLIVVESGTGEECLRRVQGIHRESRRAKQPLSLWLARRFPKRCSSNRQAGFDERWCPKLQAHFLVCPSRDLQRAKVVNFIEWIPARAADPDSAALSSPA